MIFGLNKKGIKKVWLLRIGPLQDNKFFLVEINLDRNSSLKVLKEWNVDLPKIFELFHTRQKNILNDEYIFSLYKHNISTKKKQKDLTSGMWSPNYTRQTFEHRSITKYLLYFGKIDLLHRKI